MRALLAQRIALALLLGAMVNIAVAWACSWWVLPHYVGAEPMAAEEFWRRRPLDASLTRADQPTTLFHGFGLTERCALVWEWKQLPDAQPSERTPIFGPAPRVRGPEEMCADLDAIHRENNPENVALLDVQMRQQLAQFRSVPSAPPALRVDAGWPLRSLRGWGPGCRKHLAPPMGLTSMPWATGSDRSIALMRGALVRLLPLQPLWLGFAVNTLLYAAALWLLFIATPSAVRRCLRVRRGRCPACAYPMGDSAVCSECGGRLPPRHREIAAAGP